MRFVGHFPPHTRIRVSCAGPGCPRRARTADHRHMRSLVSSLRGRVFHAGERLTITISAPGWTPERGRIRIRNGRVPVAKLLRS